MPKWLKIVLLVFGICVAFGGACVGAGVWWFSENKDRLVEMGQVAEAEGRGFAKGRTASECVAEGRRRVGDCGELDPICEAGIGIFLGACLEVATPEPGFCDGVPRGDDIMASVQYRLEVCGSDEACGRLANKIQDHCHDGD